MIIYNTSILDIYSNIFKDVEYAVDLDEAPYPMTEKEIGMASYYDALARDVAENMSQSTKGEN